MKKQLQIHAIANELRGASAFFPKSAAIPTPAQPEDSPIETPTESPVTHVSEQKVTQQTEQMSKTPSIPLSSEAIEALSFQLRKVNKTKVNAEVPESWKQKLDDIAHQLGVGKYELVMYMIGHCLGEVES